MTEQWKQPFSQPVNMTRILKLRAADELPKHNTDHTPEMLEASHKKYDELGIAAYQDLKPLDVL